MRSHLFMLVPLTAAVLLIAHVVACEDDEESASEESYGPPASDHMPEGMEALRFGESVESGVVDLIGEPTDRRADKSLGGDMVVKRNGVPALNLTWQGKAYLEEKLVDDGVAPEYVSKQLSRKTLLPDEAPWKRYHEIEAALVDADAGDPVLAWLTVKGPDGSLCDDLGKRLAEQDAATECPGNNRKTGESKGGWYYCLGNAEATANVFVECTSGKRGDVLSYWMSP